MSYKHQKGFLLADTIVGIATLGIILGLLYVSLCNLRKFNQYQLARQRCIAAACAQLDSISVTAKQISDEDMHRLWPRVDISIEKIPATGQWEGFKIVKVTAGSVVAGARIVEIESARYIREKK